MIDSSLSCLPDGHMGVTAGVFRSPPGDCPGVDVVGLNRILECCGVDSSEFSITEI